MLLVQYMGVLIVIDVTRECVQRLEQAIEKQPVRNVSLDMTDLTLDAIAKVGFGYDANSANSHTSESSLVNNVQAFMGNFAVAGYLPEPFDKLPFGGICAIINNNCSRYW